MQATAQGPTSTPSRYRHQGRRPYIGIGHFGYLNEQVYADGIEFNVDGTSQENFDRNVIALGMGLDYSLVELSSKVNGKATTSPTPGLQAHQARESPRLTKLSRALSIIVSMGPAVGSDAAAKVV